MTTRNADDRSQPKVVTLQLSRDTIQELTDNEAETAGGGFRRLTQHCPRFTVRMTCTTRGLYRTQCIPCRL